MTDREGLKACRDGFKDLCPELHEIYSRILAELDQKEMTMEFKKGDPVKVVGVIMDITKDHYYLKDSSGTNWCIDKSSVLPDTTCSPIICDPNDPRVKGLIGKEVEFADSAAFGVVERGELVKIVQPYTAYPFYISNGTVHAFIRPIPSPTPSELAEKVKAFEHASGVHIQHGWEGADKIGAAVQTVLNGDMPIDKLRQVLNWIAGVQKSGEELLKEIAHG